MADFKAEVVKLTIEEHPNADALELARVGDYLSVVQKGVYKTGDLGVYIPEQAVLPERVIAELGLEGRLAGKAKNRVKAIKLRGILSQGLIYPVEEMHGVVETNTGREPSRIISGPVYCVRIEGVGHMAEEGYDITEWMGITKYEPVIPTHMNGQVFNASGYTLKYDIENIKKHPDVLIEGEDVVITEKLHGTWACFGYHPDVEHPIITSKGLSGQGLAFKWKFPENENNLYVKAFQSMSYRDINNNRLFPDQTGTTVVDKVHRAFQCDKSTPIYVLGEVYGPGVQDLHYDGEPNYLPKFKVFDVYIGAPGQGFYVGADELIVILNQIDIPHVPVLCLMPWKTSLIEELTGGQTTLGNSSHIREGIVIKPAEERRDDELGRVVLKSVSEQYLLRKGGTEFN